MIVKLLVKHQDALYTFLHQAHNSDTIIDDYLAWLSSVVAFLRTEPSQMRQIFLAGILPSSEEALQAFAQELDDLVKYHRYRRDLQQEQMFRQQGKFLSHKLSGAIADVVRPPDSW